MGRAAAFVAPALGLILFAASAEGSAAAGVRIPSETTFAEYIDNLSEEYSFFTVSNLWLLIAAAMVFVMHTGFAMLESGLSRAKNTREHSLQEFLCHQLRACDVCTCWIQYDVSAGHLQRLHPHRRVVWDRPGQVHGGDDVPLGEQFCLLDGFYIPGDVRGHGGDDCFGRGG